MFLQKLISYGWRTSEMKKMIHLFDKTNYLIKKCKTVTPTPTMRH